MAGAVAIHGDRDPRVAPGLDGLRAGRWDAVIDTSGYVPRIVEASSALLHPLAGRYLFVSSLSVLAKPDRPGLDELAEVATLDPPDSEDVSRHYGALKAACERVIVRAFDERATIVRPGLIVGPYDSTDRFGYWPARFVHPELLGDRAGHAVVPAPRERAIQCIDARDLAAWMLDLCEGDRGGTFNAASPASHWTFGDLVDTCMAAASSPPEPVWVDEATLEPFHVAPWVGLPLWLPASENDHAGFLHIDTQRAMQAGLVTRPLSQTVADTAAWLATRDNRHAWQHVLSDARERQILSALKRAAHVR